MLVYGSKGQMIGRWRKNRKPLSVYKKGSGIHIPLDETRKHRNYTLNSVALLTGQKGGFVISDRGVLRLEERGVFGDWYRFYSFRKDEVKIRNGEIKMMVL